MTPQPTVNEIVAITTTDNDPLLLVSSTIGNHVTGVLLADPATEKIHGLQASESDTATRQKLATVIKQAGALMSVTVPTAIVFR